MDKKQLAEKCAIPLKEVENIFIELGRMISATDKGVLIQEIGTFTKVEIPSRLVVVAEGGGNISPSISSVGVLFTPSPTLLNTDKGA